MEYIKAKCTCALMDCECLVDKFVAMPQVGQYVEVLISGYRSEMKIYKITHCIDVHNEPYIDVILTK